MTRFEPLPFCGWLWLAWAFYWWRSARLAAKTAVVETPAQRRGHILPTAASIWLLLWPSPPGPLGAVWLHGSARWTGAALAAAGLLLCVWARVHLGRYWSAEVALKEDHRLIRSGPYALARHPIYTGFLSAIAGTAVAGGRAAGLLAFAIAVPAYWIKLRREDALLAGAFGADYERYRREVGALFPRLPTRR
jgi:protein-S-isoprenylcysteine O-methyltransferase Ste14